MKGFHPKSSCMKRKIDHISFLLKKNYITLPGGARKTDYGEKIEDHDERFHVLKASCSK